MKIRNQKGFTLVEVMIALAIIVVFSSVAIPALIKYSKESKTRKEEANNQPSISEQVTYEYDLSPAGTCFELIITEHPQFGRVLVSAHPLEDPAGRCNE